MATSNHPLLVTDRRHSLADASADTLVAMAPLPLPSASSRVYPGNTTLASPPAPRANTAQGMYGDRVAAINGVPERTNSDLPPLHRPGLGGTYSSSEFVLTVGDDDDEDDDESEYATVQMQKQRLFAEDKGSGVDWGLGRCDSGHCQQQRAGYPPHNGRSFSPMEADTRTSGAHHVHARRIPWYKDGCFLSKAAIFLVIFSWIALVMYMVLSYDPATAAAAPSPTPSSPPPSS